MGAFGVMERTPQQRFATIEEMLRVQLDSLSYIATKLHHDGHHEASTAVSNARLKMEEARDELFTKLDELGYYNS